MRLYPYKRENIEKGRLGSYLRIETMSGGHRESRSKALGHPDMEHPGYCLIRVGAGADHAD
jgi:hypothetical protein